MPKTKDQAKVNSSDTAIAAPDSYNSFLDAVSAASPTQTPQEMRPKTLRLDGKAGLFLAKEYDSEQKQYIETPFGENPYNLFSGVILAVRYFAKWKFKEGAESMVSTNEFASWDEEVKLTKLNWKKEKTDPSRLEVLSVHPTYKDFKAEYVTVDKASGTVTAPFDLYVSLYVMVGEVVYNMQFKGSSRSNMFDYFREYKTNQTDPYGQPVREMVQCLTEFGVAENTMPDGKSTYYSCTFTPVGVNSEETMKQVMPAWKFVQDYFQSQKPNVKTVEALESAGLIGDGATYADDGEKIPF